MSAINSIDSFSEQSMTLIFRFPKWIQGMFIAPAAFCSIIMIFLFSHSHSDGLTLFSLGAMGVLAALIYYFFLLWRESLNYFRVFPGGISLHSAFGPPLIMNWSNVTQIRRHRWFQQI